MTSEHDLYKYQEPAKELAKNAKISINLEGWPAATTCSVGILGLTAVVIFAMVKGN